MKPRHQPKSNISPVKSIASISFTPSQSSEEGKELQTINLSPNTTTIETDTATNVESTTQTATHSKSSVPNSPSKHKQTTITSFIKKNATKKTVSSTFFVPPKDGVCLLLQSLHFGFDDVLYYRQ